MNMWTITDFKFEDNFEYVATDVVIDKNGVKLITDLDKLK